MTDDFAKMSKSARRRARQKLAKAAGGQPEPAPERPAEVLEPSASRPKGAGERQLTITLPERHWQVFDWLCGGKGHDMQSEAATKMIRQFCINQLPRWREAQGMKSGSVRAEDFKAEE